MEYDSSTMYLSIEKSLLKRKLEPCPKPIKEVKARRKWWKKKPKKDLGLPVSKSKLIKNDCLDLWFEIIHLIYNETCAACGRVSGCSGHHFFGQKAYPSVKFDLDNGVLLCVGCHIMKVHKKGQTEIARDALIMRIGIDRFEALKKRANSSRKYLMQELLALRVQLKQVKLDTAYYTTNPLFYPTPKAEGYTFSLSP